MREEAGPVPRGDEPSPSRLGNGSDLSHRCRDDATGRLPLCGEVAVGGGGGAIEREDAAAEPFTEQAGDRLGQGVATSALRQTRKRGRDLGFTDRGRVQFAPSLGLRARPSQLQRARA